MLGRHGDDGEIDRPFDRADRGEAGDEVDLRRVRVDGVERAAEARVAEIVQHLGAEVAARATGADDGDRARREDRLHRRESRLLRALRVGVGRGLGQLDREGHVHRALARAARGVEAAAEEDVEHALVLRQHLGLELDDAVRPRDLGELFQQLRADAAAVVLVGDRERALRRGRSARKCKIVRNGDDLLADLTDHAEVVDVVDVDRRIAQRLLGRAEVEEARVEALGREAAEHPLQPLGVVRPDGADAQGPAVAQDDVGFEMGGVGDGFHFKLRPPRRLFPSPRRRTAPTARS